MCSFFFLLFIYIIIIVSFNLHRGLTRTWCCRSAIGLHHLKDKFWLAGPCPIQVRWGERKKTGSFIENFKIWVLLHNPQCNSKTQEHCLTCLVADMFWIYVCNLVVTGPSIKPFWQIGLSSLNWGANTLLCRVLLIRNQNRTWFLVLIWLVFRERKTKNKKQC